VQRFGAKKLSCGFLAASGNLMSGFLVVFSCSFCMFASFGAAVFAADVAAAAISSAPAPAPSVLAVVVAVVAVAVVVAVVVAMFACVCLSLFMRVFVSLCLFVFVCVCLCMTMCDYACRSYCTLGSADACRCLELTPDALDRLGDRFPC